MVVETLSQISVGMLPLVGIALALKDTIRRRHPDYGQARIEVAHKVDSFLGGGDEEENLQPLTIVEHLVDHVTKAEQAPNWDIARRQYSSAQLIAQRMTEDERKLANEMLVERKRHGV